MRTMVIMRGISGSGKSTYAHSLGMKVRSTDDLFMVGHEYIFVPTKLKENHKKNKELVRQDLIQGHNVVVDNTNTQWWEIEPYVKMAIEFGYQVQFVTIDCAAEIAAKRNAHGVPIEVISKQLARMEPHNEIVRKYLAIA